MWEDPRIRTSAAQFSTLLSRFPPAIVALVRRCMPKLRRALPGALELVYDYRASLVVAFGPSERGNEATVALAIDPRRVRLYLPKDLPDPKGRLEGSGTKVRSVVVEAASELDRGGVHDLLEAAVQRARVPSPRTRPTRKLVTSSSKRKRSKRPRRA